MSSDKYSKKESDVLTYKRVRSSDGFKTELRGHRREKNRSTSNYHRNNLLDMLHSNAAPDNP